LAACPLTATTIGNSFAAAPLASVAANVTVNVGLIVVLTPNRDRVHVKPVVRVIPGVTRLVARSVLRTRLKPLPPGAVTLSVTTATPCAATRNRM
jgi:hypothetical protein